MTIRSMSALAAAALLVGAHSPEAHADTPTFPDLSRYTPVDFADYAIDTSTPGFTASTIAFLTPDGISCDFMIEQAQWRVPGERVQRVLESCSPMVGEKGR